ncbi:MAG: hypothetical protein A2Y17_13625 [Clostridiales bacterium GWF2_38_85]|nr:MAG: hypothetical protein A2Y17_13625 [Clostridiales bacterium GWF2_38_85]
MNNKNMDKRFFKILYTLYALSSIGFAIRIFTTSVLTEKEYYIGIPVCVMFIALAVFYIYIAFFKKEGFEKSNWFYRLEYAGFGIVLIQIALSTELFK